MAFQPGKKAPPFAKKGAPPAKLPNAKNAAGSDPEEDPIAEARAAGKTPRAAKAAAAGAKTPRKSTPPPAATKRMNNQAAAKAARKGK
jgi:hypothetical protein